MSCAPAGSCAAGGWYYDNRHHQHGFVAIERHGRWGRAIQVPGLAALSTGESAEVNSVSCAPAGTCAAVGDYLTTRQFQGFVALETERPVGQGDRDTRPGGAEQGRDRHRLLGVMPPGRRLRRRRGLHRRPISRPGIRREPDQITRPHPRTSQRPGVTRNSWRFAAEIHGQLPVPPRRCLSRPTRSTPRRRQHACARCPPDYSPVPSSHLSAGPACRSVR